jgi:RNA-directed DNA polymerase
MKAARGLLSAIAKSVDEVSAFHSHTEQTASHSPRYAKLRLSSSKPGMRHLPIRQQTDCLNQMLRGHYAYYGIAGNLRALQRVHRAVERYWRKMLSSRS